MAKPNDRPTAIAGRKPVLAALSDENVSLECVYVRQALKGSIVAAIRSACKARGVPVKFVPPEKLDRLAGKAVHQGVVALTSNIEVMDLDDMLSEIAPSWDATERTKPLLLIADRISDPHNLGAIVRSAVAFDCSGIILPEHRSAPLGAATIKASAGTALKARFAKVTNLTQAIDQLKERGYWIAGLAGKGNVTLEAVDWDRPIALVVGSESDGISRRVEAACDLLVSIPISQGVESLNAAVAAGIALQAASRVRRAQHRDLPD